MTLGYKDIKIRKSEFLAKTQLLCRVCHLDARETVLVTVCD